MKGFLFPWQGLTTTGSFLFSCQLRVESGSKALRKYKKQVKKATRGILFKQLEQNKEMPLRNKNILWKKKKRLFCQVFGFTNKPRGRAFDAQLRFGRSEDRYRKVPSGLHTLLWKGPPPNNIPLQGMILWFVCVASCGSLQRDWWNFISHTGWWVLGIHFTIMLYSSHPWISMGTAGTWVRTILGCVEPFITHGCQQWMSCPLV